jgi:hypothetical protein
VLFAAAIAAAALVAGLIVALAARRLAPSLNRWGRAVAIGAGLAVASVSLGYLTLLYMALRSSGAGLHSAAWSVAGLTVAVAISLLMGHAVTLTALALIVAGTGSPIRTPGVPGTSWRALLAAGAVSFVAALAIANASDIRFRGQSGPAPRLTVVPTGLRVRLIAIDGFDDRIFARLSAAGRLPALTAALAGARATLSADDVDPPTAVRRIDPARLWTTIATGQPSARHGVRTLETRRVAGLSGILQADSTLGRLLGASTDLLRLAQPSIVSGTDRRERTFWEVAAGAGLRTAVINWWATWPAVSDDGVVVSDRAMLRLERGGPLDAEVAPAALYDKLERRWLGLRAHANKLANTALSRTDVDGESAAVLRRSAELDAMMLLLAGEVAGPAMDLTAIYLPGLDIAQHALAGDEGLTASTPAARVAAIEAYYAALDALFGEANHTAPRDLVMTLTAPGRVLDARAGGLVLRGPGIRRDAVVNGRTTDVAPSLLYALGVPLSEQLAGRPLLDLFESAFVARYAVRHVETYGPPSSSGRRVTGRALDDEALERLRSLGYVR